MESIVEEISAVAKDVAADNKVELVHVEILGSKRDSVVRIYIDKPEGVTLDDCTRFSHMIEAVLDARDLIPGTYTLEISSPGIERQLYSISDFERFNGELAKVALLSEVEGQKNFVGHIRGVEGSTIEFEDRTKGMVSFDYSQVKKANLKIDLGKELRGGKARNK
ncbi:MAG: Ribosome maturation factor RimP [Acidobacteria bacterium OLB17]|nr:MAG: Ribosome maturation factor RimP [Acidobacteria bacterium OLB17]MCZ2389730.1 ribosome maturation factor RimP [Acidobacteriota bacterium]